MPASPDIVAPHTVAPDPPVTESGVADEDEDAEPATPSFNAFTYPVQRGSAPAPRPAPPVEATPPAETAPAKDDPEEPPAPAVLSAAPPSPAAYEDATVGREDLAAALEQLAAVAQFSAGLTSGDVPLKDVAQAGPVPTVEAPGSVPAVGAGLAQGPAEVPSQPVEHPAKADERPAPDLRVESTPMVVAPAEEPASSLVPSKEDVAGWTCAECVYVTTCPRSGQDRPATCGSFQWRTG